MAWSQAPQPSPLIIFNCSCSYHPSDGHDALYYASELDSASPWHGPGTPTLLVKQCAPGCNICIGPSLISTSFQQQNASTTFATSTSAAAPSATPDYLAICESQASSYADSCPQCLYRCIGSQYVEQCYWSTFFTVNGIQAQCEAQGGWNCRQTALADVCPGPSSS